MLKDNNPLGSATTQSPRKAEDPARQLRRPEGSSIKASEAPTDSPTAVREKRHYDPGPVDRSKVVQKPIPQAQANDPREFQVQQVRRRFTPKETIDEYGSALAFTMAPSDPDFPFEMVGLDCVLHVPKSYPQGDKPSLQVRNTEMGRGYQINVERGFDVLVVNRPQATLLALMNALDKQLESLLTEQKAETIKIIPNASSTKPKQPVETRKSPEPQSASRTVHRETFPRPQKSYTSEHLRSAQGRRDAETRQLEARLGRLPLYHRSSDGIVYTLPIEPRRRLDLPLPLQAVKSIKLFVPLLYPLQPCRIEIEGISGDATSNTEKAFEQKAKDNSEMTLMGHVNYLSQNMHMLATELVERISVEPTEDLEAVATEFHRLNVEPSGSQRLGHDEQEPDDDRSHVKFIPRPPEWAWGDKGKARNDSDYSDSYDSGDEFTDEGSEDEPETAVEASRTRPERGILLSFPHLELYGIELLELTSLCVTIKCERCKSTMDVNSLHNTASGDASGLRAESCKKCASPLSIGKIDGLSIYRVRRSLNVVSAGYRRELMHANSVRVGYLDLDGCSVVDMLPR